jgi:hypothetical protein
VDVVLDEPVDQEPAVDEVPEVDDEPAPSAPDGDDRVLVDEPTAAIGPPIAASPAIEPGHVGVAVKAEMLQEPSLPPFLAPLRAIFDPSRKWLYWIRGSLTVVVMLVLFLVLAWAAGELFDGLGEVLDTIESTDDGAIWCVARVVLTDDDDAALSHRTHQQCHRRDGRHHEDHPAES